MEFRINRRGLMGGVFGGAFALGLGLPAAARSVAAAPPSPADVTRYANELLERTYPANGPGAAVLVAAREKGWVVVRAAGSSGGRAEMAAGSAAGIVYVNFHAEVSSLCTARACGGRCGFNHRHYVGEG